MSARDGHSKFVLCENNETLSRQLAHTFQSYAKCHPKRSEGPVHSGSILRKNLQIHTVRTDLHLRLRMTPIADAKWLDLGNKAL